MDSLVCLIWEPDTGKYDKHNWRAHKASASACSWANKHGHGNVDKPRDHKMICVKYLICVFFSASTHRLFPRNLPHNRANAEWPSQDHRVASASQRRPHQGVPLPDPPGRQVPPQLQDHPQGHQAWKSLGKLQLCSENMWFRLSEVSNRKPSHIICFILLWQTIFKWNPD